MMKFLIAVDGSEQSNRAIEAVGHLARSSVNLEVRLICVSPEPVFYGDYTATTIQRIEEEQKRQQDTILTNATALAVEQGLKLDDAVRAYGVIANEIVQAANDMHADQIAMGTRGMGAIGNLFIGSVAQRVLQHAEVPVLLVR